MCAEVSEKVILSRKMGADFVVTQNFLKRGMNRTGEELIHEDNAEQN